MSGKNPSESEIIGNAIGLKMIAPLVHKLKNGRLMPFDPLGSNMDCAFASCQVGVGMPYIAHVVNHRPGMRFLSGDDMQETRSNAVRLMLEKLERAK